MKPVDILTRLTGHLVKKGVKPAVAKKIALQHLQRAGDIKKGSTELTAQGRYRDAVPSKDRPTKKAGGYNMPTKY